MSQKILSILVLCTAALSLASCLDDEKEELVYYDDTAVTSFSVGTLNKYYTVKASTGEDSIVKSGIDCSRYKFSIDNYANTIYNVDSLPVGVDAGKVVCTIYTKNSGLALWYYKSSTNTDSLVYCSTTDSVDFTEAKELRVYNTSMTAYRKYTVSLNVHQEAADSFVWKNFDNDAVAASLKNMKSVCLGGKIYLFGSDGASTKVYQADSHEFSGFAPYSASSVTLGAEAYRNVAMLNNNIYILDGSSLIALDASGITTITDNAPITRLIGAGNNRIYGYAADGNIMYSTNGETWQEGQIDDSADLLPTTDINLIAMPSKTNADTYQLTLVGNNGGNLAQVWGKVEESVNATEDQTWSHYVTGNENPYRLPALASLNAIRYDRNIVALGLNGNNLTDFYTSEDAGITWHNDSTIVKPVGLDQNPQAFTMTTDEDNHIWIICGGNGQIWRGRLNRLGWANKNKD